MRGETESGAERCSDELDHEAAVMLVAVPLAIFRGPVLLHRPFITLPPPTALMSTLQDRISAAVFSTPALTKQTAIRLRNAFLFTEIESLNIIFWGVGQDDMKREILSFIDPIQVSYKGRKKSKHVADDSLFHELIPSVDTVRAATRFQRTRVFHEERIVLASQTRHHLHIFLDTLTSSPFPFSFSSPPFRQHHRHRPPPSCSP